MKPPKKLCFVTAVPMTIEAFLLDLLKVLATKHNITVITGTEDPFFLVRHNLKNIQVIPIQIKRKISPFHDISALWHLYRTFKKHSFDLVHSFTPKAGLLTMIAGRLARIPIRIHTFTGQVWATKRGLKRWFLKKMDIVITLCATHVLADSTSQRIFIVKEGVSQPQKIGIIGNGSISGVDTDRFSPSAEVRKHVRQRLKIEFEAPVFLFLGRLNKEKGIFDLYEAFKKVAATYENAHLIIVGPDEEKVMEKIYKNARTYRDRIHYEGKTRTPELYMKASDCVCLPSYREGFGLVVIEAAACGIPAIGTRIYGIVDAIEEKETGLLHTPGDVDELSHHMEWMILHQEERQLMGQKARERVKKLFSKENIISVSLDFYEKVISQNE
ncbi:MAG: glycosyltransferase family 4 protein [Syntrophales bacterium]|nr:glycosyltransferase family 4 protein [Syntrophales bacterium]